jgi:hypothetical protein
VKPRTVLVVGIVAVVASFLVLLAPLGVGLGILALVQGVRAYRATRPQEQDLRTPEGAPITVKVPQPGHGQALAGIVLGAVAVVVGALVLTVIALFITELREYSECRDATNTRQGEAICEDAFRDAINQRFGR